MTKWFALQANINKSDILADIKKLEGDSVFDIKIPNLVRALIGSFTKNHINFHDKSGNGYKYLSDKILEIDTFNPSISSSLTGVFKLYSKVDENRKNMMNKELNTIISRKNLSKNTYEIVYKILNEK